MAIIFGIKTCDSCRKAMKALPEFAFDDIRETGLPDPILKTAVEKFGSALVNRRSTTWRALDEAARAMPEAELLRAHPLVMKRPLIETSGDLYLGWDAAVAAALTEA